MRQDDEVIRQAFDLWYAIRHPKTVHENPTWAHARKCDDYEVWRAASGAYLRRIAELEAELIAEAKKTASEKLRADQMAEQHRMQAKMHSEAREELAALKAPTPTPSNPVELETATPWYPDDSGEWVEVPEDLMEMPAELCDKQTIEILYLQERKNKDWMQCADEPDSWGWSETSGKNYRIVAYKVAKP